MTNKFNFIEGHETKLLRLKNEKLRERQMDNNTIRIALNEIDRENQRKRDEMVRSCRTKSAIAFTEPGNSGFVLSILFFFRFWYFLGFHRTYAVLLFRLDFFNV